MKTNVGNVNYTTLKAKRLENVGKFILFKIKVLCTMLCFDMRKRENARRREIYKKGEGDFNAEKENRK